MNLSEEYGMPKDGAEINLLLEAENAATKCGICGEYGHRWEACKKACGIHLVGRYEPLKVWSPWLTIFGWFFAACAVTALYEWWRG